MSYGQKWRNLTYLRENHNYNIYLKHKKNLNFLIKNKNKKGIGHCFSEVVLSEKNLALHLTLMTKNRGLTFCKDITWKNYFPSPSFV